MALIEVFHVVAAGMPVQPNATPDIPQGMLVTLDTDGYIEPCDGDTDYAIGVAGDSRSDGVTSYTPESGSSLSRDPKGTMTGALVTSAYGGGRRFTQNRIADNYNEVQASGEMTVYHSGGQFFTDQYEIVLQNESVANYAPGLRLYSSHTDSDHNLNGRFTLEVPSTSQVVGFVVSNPGAYPSGVPGTETGFLSLPEGGNSLSWGNFLQVKLSI